MKPEIGRAIENPLSLKERETTMNNLFTDTTTDQHDHDHPHGTAGSDVEAGDGDNPNSESTHHDEKANHHQEKESKEMNRSIKTSSAPILTGFTLSLMFFLCAAFNAKAFDARAFDEGVNQDNLYKVLATANFGVGNQNFGQVARSCQDEATIRFINNQPFSSDNRSFARVGENEFIGFRENVFVNVDDTNFARLDFEPTKDGDINFAEFDRKNSFRFEGVSPLTAYNARLLGLDNGCFDVNNNYQVARVDSFSGKTFVG
jgi:hypothetical protein